MNNRRCLLSVLALVLAAMPVAAQAVPDGQQGGKQAPAIANQFAAVRAAIRDTQSQTSTFAFVASEGSFDARMVKGAPFSADAVTAFNQTLINGQHISRKSTSSWYRDSEGRTRREQTVDYVGPYGASTPHKTIYITDPVAGVSYILDPDNHTATKGTAGVVGGVAGARSGGGGGVIGGIVGGSGGGGVAVARGGGQGGAVSGGTGGVIAGARGVQATGTEPRAVNTPFGAITAVGSGTPSNTRTESLGTQLIEGVQAEGTRTIETIPTGAIGNDSPIEIVSERWFSPELQLVIATSRTDPRSGENTFRVTNISRGGPSPSLFQVPPDYVVKEAGAGAVGIKK